jgi:ATP-dependent RNA helicase DeaD
MSSFESLNLSEQLKKAINRLGFKIPTQIQKDTIPLILEGKDVIGESATGSGKTLAFGAGIVKNCNPNEGLQAIVLVPTRELAEQVKDEMIKFSFEKDLKILAIYGGVSINPQIDHLKKSEVVIATPGRLLDHIDRKTINTSKVKIIVLDEADRMVEMGFIEDVEKIINVCPEKRQTLLFSATIQGLAKEITLKYMKEPITIFATKMVDPTKLKQIYYNVPYRLKKDLLVHLLKNEKSDLVMVFCNTRLATDMVVEKLKENGIKAIQIHGGLNQPKRLKIIDMFHKGRYNILVCTDVAARGLHIEGVTHIYNFDIPKDPPDYVHRIGRTARAGKNGFVINILSHRDFDNFSRLLSSYDEFQISEEKRPYIESSEMSNNSNDFSNKGKKIFNKDSSKEKSPNRSSNFRKRRTFRKNKPINKAD